MMRFSTSFTIRMIVFCEYLHNFKIAEVSYDKFKSYAYDNGTVEDGLNYWHWDEDVPTPWTKED